MQQQVMLVAGEQYLTPGRNKVSATLSNVLSTLKLLPILLNLDVGSYPRGYSILFCFVFDIL